MRWSRPWSAPALKEGVFQFMPGDANKPPRRVVGLKGHWSAADFYVESPEGLIDVTYRIFVLCGNFRILLEYATLRQRLSETSGGRAAGLLFSIRGRPCDGFHVDAIVATQDEPADVVKCVYRLETWGEDGIHGDMAAPQLVQPYATMPRALSATVQIAPAGVGVITPILWPPAGRTAHVTHFSVSTDDPACRRWELLSTVTLRMEGAVIDGSPFIAPLPMPLRGDIGQPWQVLISGLAAPNFAWFNASGYAT